MCSVWLKNLKWRSGFIEMNLRRCTKRDRHVEDAENFMMQKTCVVLS